MQLIIPFFRAHADHVLGKAKNVVEALDAADNAQIKANEAILQANVDIDLAKSDLEQVCDKSSNALELI